VTGAGVLALLVVVAVIVAVLVAVFRPASVWQRWADERPSPVAGDPVPPLRRPPEARIAVAGDTGTGDAAERRTVQRIAQQGRVRPYDALVLLGDLVYEDGDAELVGSRVTGPFSPVLAAGTELVPVLGNHDYESGEQHQILAALGRQRSWYAEWVGPVRLLVLDTMRVEDEAQTRWLRRATAPVTLPATS